MSPPSPPSCPFCRSGMSAGIPRVACPCGRLRTMSRRTTGWVLWSVNPVADSSYGRRASVHAVPVPDGPGVRLEVRFRRSVATRDAASSFVVPAPDVPAFLVRFAREAVAEEVMGS